MVLKYDDPSKVTRLQDCPKDVIDKVKLTFDALKISKINIKMNDFMTFWEELRRNSTATDGVSHPIQERMANII